MGRRNYPLLSSPRYNLLSPLKVKKKKKIQKKKMPTARNIRALSTSHRKAQKAIRNLRRPGPKASAHQLLRNGKLARFFHTQHPVLR
jgi:hypothetical protein